MKRELLMKIGIDPGRYKIGFAIVNGSNLLFSAIIPKTDEKVLAEAIKTNDWKLLSAWNKEGNIEAVSNIIITEVLIGDGTSSDEIQSLLSDLITVRVVNEYGTTLQGRKLYWVLHKPRGFWKLIPTSLRTPPRDIDDLAAWAIVNVASNS